MKIQRPDGFVHNGKTRDFKKQTANDRVNQQNNSHHFPPPLFHCLLHSVYCLGMPTIWLSVTCCSEGGRSPSDKLPVSFDSHLCTPHSTCLPFAYCPLPK